MNRIYDALKVHDGHGNIFDQKALARDVAQLEEVGSSIAVKECLTGLKRPFPVITVSSSARDQIAHLVDRVFLFPVSVAPRILAFSNIDVGTGSSEVCFNVGNLLAERASGNVCVIDANGKQSLLGRLVASNGLRGLCDAMDITDGCKDFLVQLGDSNLWLLPAGSAGAHPCTFSPDRLHARLMELRKHFDYILIDAPVATAPSTLMLGQAADGVIIVIEAHRTRRENALMAKEVLEAAHIPVIGSVLNNRTFPIPGAIYRKL